MRDLSHPITSDMIVYPGDPEVHVTPALTLERDGVAVTHLDMGSHTGTHVDAPSHTVAGGRTIDQVELEELTGQARIINVPHVIGRELRPSEAIEWEHLGLHEYEPLPRIVAVATGWDRYFGESTYLEHPFLTGSAVQRLWEAGMRVLAVDTLSPDNTGGKGFPAHDVVLGGDGLIVENVRDLTSLEPTANLMFLPLRLTGVDGSPVRAVAW